MLDLTVSIGTLDNYPILERCLRSIYDHTSGLNYEVCVVYNGAGNDTVFTAIKENFPQVRLTVKKGPLGFCAVHNLVLNQAQSRYVLVLDDDTIVAPGALSIMISFMDHHPDVGMAGCKTFNPDGTFQKTYGLAPRLGTEWANAFKPDAFWDESLYRDVSTVKEVEWLNGSFMLARSDAIKKVGTFDEYYYTYVCESDWCYRMKKAGWRVVYVPDATIIHVGNQHSIKNKLTTTDYIGLIRSHVNRYYFFHKHHGRFALFLLRPIMIMGSALRIINYTLMYLFHKERRPMAATKLKAFWDVIKLSLSPKPYKLPGNLNFNITPKGSLPTPSRVLEQ